MRKWSLVCLLSVALALGYTHRTNISYALADKNFVNFFNLSDTERGIATSAFFWTYGLLQLPAGALVDRMGAKFPLSIGLFCWCLFSAAAGSATTFWMLITFRLLLGLGEAIVLPAGLRWIRDEIDERHRGLATGMFISGSKYGPAVAAPIAAWLIKEHGWRTMFWDQGLAGLLWLAPWLLFATAGRGSAAGPANVSPRIADRAAPSSMSLFRSKLMWGVLIGTFCYNYFATFALSWLPAYFVERRHLSLTSMGIYTGFSFAGTAIVAILGGFAADRMIARGADPVATRRGFTVAGLLIASTVIIGAVVQSVDAAVFFSILSMAGLGLATANYWSLTQVIMPKEIAGRAAGAQNMAVTAAGIVAPIATGWLKQISGGYTVPMAAIAVLMAVGISAYMFMVRVPRQTLAGQELVHR